MYNEGNKRSFLLTIGGDTQRSVAVATFNMTETYEIKAGKDLCQFSADELAPIVAQVSSLGAGKNSTRMKIIKQYLNWCYATSYPGAVLEINKVPVPFIETYRKKMVSGPAQLQKCLDVYYDKEDLLTVDNVFRCYVWFAFLGIDNRDVTSITKDNIDLDRMIIMIGNNVYEIYEEAVPCIRNCITQPVFMYHHPLYEEDYVPRNRVPGKEVLRGIKALLTEQQLSEVLSRRGGKLKDKPVPRISYKSVFMSGIFYRQYMLERSVAYVGEMSVDINTFYDILSTMRYRDCLSEQANKMEAWVLYHNYIKWKLAFSI